MCCDLIEVFKIINEIDHLENMFLIDNDNRTRKNRFHLKIKRHVNKNIALNYYSRRVIKHWNSLPSVVVESENLCIFKKRLDFYMKK